MVTVPLLQGYTHTHTHTHTCSCSVLQLSFSCLHFWPLTVTTVTHSRLCQWYPQIRTEAVVAVASHHEVLWALWEFHTKEEVGAESYNWLSIRSLLCCRWRRFTYYEHTRVITPIFLSGHSECQTLTHQPYASSHTCARTHTHTHTRSLLS